MFGQSAKRWMRGAVVALAGAALTLGMAAPAAAETPATGKPTSLDGSRVKLQFEGKGKDGNHFRQQRQGRLPAPAHRLTARRVPVYCIDFHTAVKIGGVYQEDAWDESRVRNLAKVQWVLAHSYPNVDSGKIVAAAKVTVPANLKQGELDNLLYFGAQTAIWQLSDEVKLASWVEGKDLLDKEK